MMKGEALQFLNLVKDNQPKHKQIFDVLERYLEDDYYFNKEDQILGINILEVDLNAKRIISLDQENLYKQLVIQLNKAIQNEIKMLPSLVIKKQIYQNDFYFDMKQVDSLFISSSPDLLGLDMDKFDNFERQNYSQQFYLKDYLHEKTSQIKYLKKIDKNINIVKDTPVKNKKKYLHCVEIKHRLKYEIFMQQLKYRNMHNKTYSQAFTNFSHISYSIISKCNKSKNFLKLLMLFSLDPECFDWKSINIYFIKYNKTKNFKQILQEKNYLKQIEDINFKPEDKYQIDKLWRSYKNQFNINFIIKFVKEQLEIKNNKFLSQLKTILYAISDYKDKSKDNFLEKFIHSLFENINVCIDNLKEKGEKIMKLYKLQQNKQVDQIIYWFVYFGNTENYRINLQDTEHHNVRILYINKINDLKCYLMKIKDMNEINEIKRKQSIKRQKQKELLNEFSIKTLSKIKSQIKIKILSEILENILPYYSNFSAINFKFVSNPSTQQWVFQNIQSKNVTKLTYSMKITTAEFEQLKLLKLLILSIQNQQALNPQEVPTTINLKKVNLQIPLSKIRIKSQT